jgi:uncharacterized protein
MNIALGGQAIAAQQRLPLEFSKKATLAIVCLCAGVAPIAGRWIPDDVVRISYGLVVTAAYLGFTLVARKQASLRQFWELSLAFTVLAAFWVLNGSVPGYVGTYILHAPPNAGNPMASTVSGTVVIQLLQTFIAVALVVGATLLSGRDLGSIYVQKGVVGKWLVVAIGVFVVVYLFVLTLPLRPDSPARQLLPSDSTLSIDRVLALTPALLVVAIANGFFEEEFLFRGLFLRKYEWFLGARLANLLQAAIFSVAHVGITYTPSALLFIALLVFPLGLIAGYLMRATRSVITPGIVHAAVDMAIYMAFLSYAA